MNLYELSTAYQQIQTMIEDGQEGLEDTLESLNDAIEDKAVGYAKVMKNLEAQANAIKDEEKRLAERRKSLENNIKRLKDSLEAAMISSDMKRIKTELFSFNIQKTRRVCSFEVKNPYLKSILFRKNQNWTRKPYLLI